MTSDEGDFWDRRYRAEGTIWGEEPSPTAVLAAPYLAAGARVLDIGSGYGRDLAFLAGRACGVVGVEISGEGHRLARQRLDELGGGAAQLLQCRFEDAPLPEETFDAILSHRMAHLLLGSEAVAGFAAKLHRLLRPGGILAIGARGLDDLDPAEMVRIGEQIYEYRRRPGHHIRYWDDESFRQVFGARFTILALTHAVEGESRANPVPCHLTVMIARKMADAASSGHFPCRREEPLHATPHR